jgi:dTMP kinase
MTTPPAPRSALSLITSGVFSRFWWAGVIGSTGDWITVFATIALGDSIADETGVLVALVSRILPGLLLGAWIGVISDRMDRRKLVVIADVGRGLLVPLLVFATNLPTLVAINLLLEMFSLVGQTPRNAMVPRLVRPENLVTANSLMLGATYGTVPVGAAFNWFLAALPAVTLGGFIPDLTSELALAFGVDALTFFASAFLIASLPVIQTKHAADTSADAPGALVDMLEGVRFFWRRRSVRRVIIGMTAALVGGGTMIVAGKSFVEDVLNADTAGFFAIITAMGTGVGIGIVVVSLYESRLLRRDIVFALSTLATGIGLVAASLTSTVAGAGLWMLVMGFGAGSAYVMGLTHIHEQVSDELRGRIFATMFALMRTGLFVSMAAVAPLELLLRGVGIAGISDPTRLVLALGGLVIVLAGVVTLWSLRDVLGTPKLGAETRDIIARASEARRLARGKRKDTGQEERE